MRLIVHPSAAGASNCVRAYFVWHPDLLKKKANDDIPQDILIRDFFGSAFVGLTYCLHHQVSTG